MTGPRNHLRFAVSALALAGALAVSGCDASEDADTARGRQLFSANCKSCHALAEAGSTANIGPDLDAAFAQARADGMDNDTIEGVVQKQIAHPRIPNEQEGTPEYNRVYMPADLVTGQDAEDVATYVASVAGVPGAKPPPLGAPEEIFADKCGSCHTLEPGAPDGFGPNLAEALKGEDADFIRQQIVKPDSDIYPGFEPGRMPQDFEDQLDGKVDALVAYILKEVGGGK